MSFSGAPPGSNLAQPSADVRYVNVAGDTMTGPLVLPAGTATAGTAPLKLTAGTLLTAAEAGAVEFDADAFYASIAAGVRGLLSPKVSARIDTPLSLVDDASAQAIFPAAYDALTVVAGKTYRFRLLGRLTNGATSASLSFLIAGGATFTSINYLSFASNGASGTSGTPGMNNGEVATAVLILAASVGVNKRFKIEGEFEVNTGGTFIPQVQYGAVTNGAVTVNVGTFFEAERIGGNPVTSIGPWA